MKSSVEISTNRHTVGRGAPKSLCRLAQALLLLVGIVGLMGAGDDAARFNSLGHKMMCVCGCSQILLECNHVGCSYSDHMRNELAAAIERGDSDDLALQGFVQKYGTTVIAAPASTGFDRLAWIMPFLALAVGIAATVLIVRAWKSRPALATPSGVKPVKGAELERYRELAREETRE
jgi:cytochrome c-type biogenesis protein CcmH